MARSLREELAQSTVGMPHGGLTDKLTYDAGSDTVDVDAANFTVHGSAVGGGGGGPATLSPSMYRSNVSDAPVIGTPVPITWVPRSGYGPSLVDPDDASQFRFTEAGLWVVAVDAAIQVASGAPTWVDFTLRVEPQREADATPMETGGRYTIDGSTNERTVVIYLPLRQSDLDSAPVDYSGQTGEIVTTHLIPAQSDDPAATFYGNVRAIVFKLGDLAF